MKTLFALALMLTAASLAADEFSRWTWRVPSPPSILFRKVIFAQDQFVAVGEAGAIMTSTNGTRWFLEETVTTNRLQNVLCSDRFVASGNYGTVVVSPEARHWQLATFPSNNLIAALAYGNDVYVALDHTGYFFRSTNALAWTPTSTRARTGGTDMVFGEGMFVAVGPFGMILTSPNGLDWVERESGTTGGIVSIAYGEGRFVAVGGEGTQGLILFSEDGINWVFQLTDTLLTDVTYADGRFVIVGGNFGGPGVSLSSDDGTYFAGAEGASGLDRPMHGVACGNGVCVAVGVGVFTSGDGGLTWNNVNAGPLETINDFAVRENVVVGVGYRGVILTTTNGVNWVDQRVREDSQWQAVCDNGQMFVAVGGEGALASSPDGFAWTVHDGVTTGDLSAVAHGAGRFVAVAWEATGYPWAFFVTSTNGVDWEERRPLGQVLINRGIAYGAGRFVVFGNNGVFYHSANGLTWAQANTGFSQNPIRVDFLNGQFLGFMNYAAIRSLDGISWSLHATELPGSSSVTYGNGTYLLTAIFPPVLWSSQDGLSWKPEKIGIIDLRSSVYAYDSFFVGGTVVQSQSSLIPNLERVFREIGQLNAEVFGRIGRGYELQSSTNLTDWAFEQDYTQSARQHPLTLPTGPDQRFYRVKLKE